MWLGVVLGGFRVVWGVLLWFGVFCGGLGCYNGPHSR